MKLMNVQKQMVVMLDRLAKLPHYRAEPWVFTKLEIALVGRWSVSIHEGGTDTIPAYEPMLDALTHALAHGYCRITTEHENEGLAWLWSQHKRGWLTSRELRVMKQFDHFTFDGVTVKQLGLRWHAAPIYSVSGPASSFQYEAWSWQSGVKPQVVASQALYGVTACDAIAEWVGLHYGLLWDRMAPAQQADYLERYKLAHAAVAA